MARTQIASQTFNRKGVTPSYAAPDAAGSMIPADGETVLHVKTGGTGCTVTIQIPKTLDGQSVTNPTNVIGTNSERIFGPYANGSEYMQGDGMVYLDYSSITSVTVTAYRK